MKNKVLIIFMITLNIFVICYSKELSHNNDTANMIDISLEDVIQLVLKNSLDIQIAKFDAYRKRTNLEKAESIFDTFLNASVSYLDDEKKPANTILGTKTTTNTYSFGIEKKLPTGSKLKINTQDERTVSDSSFASVNPRHEATVGLSITQQFGKNFFGLADRAQIKITKIDIENAEYSSLDNIEQALYEAQIAYWNLVLKKKQLNTRMDMLKEAKKLYDIYKEKYDLGLVESGDLFAVEANLRTRQNDVLAARLEKEIAKNDLLFLLNAEDTSVQLNPLDSLHIVPYSVDLYTSLREAIEHRRDYKIIKNQLEALDIDIKVKKNSLWPEIDLETSFLKNGLDTKYQESWQDIAGEDNSEVFVGITFKVPLENRSAKSQLKETQLKKQQSILSFKQIERLILKEIHSKVSQVNTLMDQVRLLSSIVELEESKLKEETKRLKYGRSSSDIIIRYEEDLLQARLDLTRSLFNYRVSLINLDLAKNTLLDRYWEDEL